MSATFTLIRYNPRRRARGAEAAEVEMDYGQGPKVALWMSPADIRNNERIFGPSPGLTAAREAYRQNIAFDALDNPQNSSQNAPTTRSSSPTPAVD